MGGLMQVTSRQVIFVRNHGVLWSVGLSNGLEMPENLCEETFWKKHPTLPVAFQYPCSEKNRNTGIFYTTSEATAMDNRGGVAHLKARSNLHYCQSLLGETKKTAKKRLLCYEDDEEDEERNWLL